MENDIIVEKQKEESLGGGLYVLSGLSFIPLFGVIFGIISIIIGFLNKKRGGLKLVIMGISGIIFTVLCYSIAFYLIFVQRGGIYDKLRIELTQRVLNDIVKTIEYNKIVNGNYPQSLMELGEKTGRKYVMYDPVIMRFTSKQQIFNYELVNKGKNYYLFSSGIDGVPNTKDDIYPIIMAEELKNIGYLRKD
ncbi:MAG: type II secretion system protein G [Bacillota bacterium]